jgi:Bacterial Ig domain
MSFEVQASSSLLSVTSLSPSVATAGDAAFTLTVSGANFVRTARVRWNGADRSTTFVSSTQLRAKILAADIATAGTFPVTVRNPDGGVSNAMTFEVRASVALPSVASLSPSVATAGGDAFTLTVSGANFVSGAKVRWNGADRVTTFVSATQLRANILATDIATAGTFPVTVLNPDGGLSNTMSFEVSVGGGNQAPVANNDSAATTLNTPVTINVISNDTDDVGINAGSVAIVTSPSNGTAVPNGNGTVTYTPNAGFTGVNTFRYTVADSQGAVSNQATVTVTVNAVSTEVVIDNGGPGTSYTGTWEVSGATGYYGVNSVFSRDGTKYMWSYTPTLSGNYQVSMWWTTYSNRSSAVPVDIQHSGGTTRVTINQLANGGKWNALGTYSLIGGVTYTVTVTSQPGPASTCADAVKFTGSPLAN